MKVSDLKNYKDSLYTAFCRDISDFEKNFLFISGGILAFSITFIKEIIQIDTAKFLFLLFLAWALVIISIGLMMVAFLESARFSDKLWKKTDDFIIVNQLYEDEIQLSSQQINEIKRDINDLFYQGKKYLKKLRYYSVLAFIVGLITFSMFVGINLLVEKRMVSNPKIQKSISIKIDSLEILSTDSSLNFTYDSKTNGWPRTQTNAKADSSTNTETIP